MSYTHFVTESSQQPLYKVFNETEINLAVEKKFWDRN